MADNDALGALDVPDMFAPENYRVPQSTGFPVTGPGDTGPGDSNFSADMNPQQAEAQIVRLFNEHERQRALKRAQTRTPQDRENAQKMFGKAGAITRDVATAINPMSIPGTVLDLASTPTAAEEAPSAEAQLTTRRDFLNSQIEKKLNQRTQKINEAVGRTAKTFAAQGFDEDIGRLREDLRGINGQLNAITASKAASEKGWKETTSQSEKDFWYRQMPKISGASSALVQALAKNPKAAALINVIAGSAEGAISALQPQFSDMHLPTSSPAKQQADKNWTDSNFWKYEVLPEIGEAVLWSILGSTGGAKARQSAGPVLDAFRNWRGPGQPIGPPPAVLRAIQTPTGTRYQHPTGGWASKNAVAAASPQAHKQFLQNVAKRRAGQQGPQSSKMPWWLTQMLP